MILITGGIKSGKSSLALELARKVSGPRLFIATSEAFDKEMEKKISRHKKERGAGFILREEPVEIFEALSSDKSNVCIIDCMTIWLGNLIHYNKDINRYFKILIRSLKGNEIIVTNEVGLGVIHADPMSRAYVNRLGELNKMLAKRADEVYLMVSGLKVRIK